jgi:hypothetical protein
MPSRQSPNSSKKRKKLSSHRFEVTSSLLPIDTFWFVHLLISPVLPTMSEIPKHTRISLQINLAFVFEFELRKT